MHLVLLGIDRRAEWNRFLTQDLECYILSQFCFYISRTLKYVWILSDIVFYWLSPWTSKYNIHENLTLQLTFGFGKELFHQNFTNFAPVCVLNRISMIIHQYTKFSSKGGHSLGEFPCIISECAQLKALMIDAKKEIQNFAKIWILRSHFYTTSGKVIMWNENLVPSQRYFY